MRVLIADDNQSVRSGIRSLLSHYPDWRVCAEAVDGVDAVEKAKELRPDLILMDISMPRMDGLAAARIIKQQLPHARVVMVSQYDLSLVRLQAGEIGADGCVSKDSLSRDLIPAMEAALEQKERDATPCASEQGIRTESNKLSMDSSTDVALHSSTADMNEPVNILMVDDQPAKLLSYEAILAETGECLIKAQSPSEAFDLLLKNDIALILMDVNMPGQDGFQLASEIRQHPRFHNLAIVFISGVHLTDEDRLYGYEHGAMDYISVPIIPELLRAKVKVFAELYRKTRQLEILSREMHDLSNGMIRLQDEERRRLARDLHDGLGQELSVAKMAVDAIAGATELSQAKRRAGESSAFIESSIRQIRSMSHLLHPPLLDEVGLTSALRFYVDELTKRSGIQTTLDMKLEGFPRFPAQLEIAIFRVVQEALTNVFRHSEARKAQVSILFQDEHIVVKILDDGRGITERTLRSQNLGVGISGMKQRVQELGGALVLRNTSPGTLVEAIIPLEMPTRPATNFSAFKRPNTGSASKRQPQEA